jgi:precorrin-6x reductase
LVENGDALIAVTAGTAGTEHLIRTARAKGLPVFVISVTYKRASDKVRDAHSSATGRDLAHD